MDVVVVVVKVRLLTFQREVVEGRNGFFLRREGGKGIKEVLSFCRTAKKKVLKEDDGKEKPDQWDFVDNGGGFVLMKEGKPKTEQPPKNDVLAGLNFNLGQSVKTTNYHSLQGDIHRWKSWKLLHAEEAALFFPVVVVIHRPSKEQEEWV